MLRKFAPWMRVVPYWTRAPPAVGLSMVTDSKAKQKTQKFYFGLPFNGIATNLFLASELAKRWADNGPDWADTPEAEEYFGVSQDAFDKFMADVARSRGAA